MYMTHRLTLARTNHKSAIMLLPACTACIPIMRHTSASTVSAVAGPNNKRRRSRCKVSQICRTLAQRWSDACFETVSLRNSLRDVTSGDALQQSKAAELQDRTTPRQEQYDKKQQWTSALGSTRVILCMPQGLHDVSDHCKSKHTQQQRQTHHQPVRHSATRHQEDGQ